MLHVIPIKTLAVKEVHEFVKLAKFFGQCSYMSRTTKCCMLGYQNYGIKYKKVWILVECRIFKIDSFVSTYVGGNDFKP